MPDPDPLIEREDDGDDDAGADDLQFDQAELTTPTTAGPSCEVCKRPIRDAYFEINGKVICTECQPRIEAAFRGGSSVPRMFKAGVFGIGAALAGAALYYVVYLVTGRLWGLIAVLAGFMVGGAVRKGTGGRGGLFYQFLAVFLTYSSIVAFHVPLLIEQSMKKAVIIGGPAAQPPQAQQADRANEPVKTKPIGKGEKTQAKTKDAPALDGGKTVKTEGAPVNPAVPANARKAANAPHNLPVAILLLLLWLTILVGALYALPVYVTIGDPISGLIFGFALWEAWKITKGVKLTFSGPFRVQPAKPGNTAGEVLQDGG